MAVTADILHDVYANGGLGFSVWEDLLLMTAICTAFAFLLRSSEYLRKHAFPDPEKCLRAEHIIVAVDGEDSPAPVGVKGDEVVMFQPGSKKWLVGTRHEQQHLFGPRRQPSVRREFIQSSEGPQISLSVIGWGASVHSL